MPRLIINGLSVTVSDGATVLDAAREAGVAIPTLCHLEGCEPYTSCMVCTVRDRQTDRTLPACSTPVRDGMDIEADGPAVQDDRREVLNLLLSEHVGNCEGPCRQACPAEMDIPGMISRVEFGDLAGAVRLARDALILPRTLSRICPAPCEMTCRRRLQDEAVGIRGLVQFVMDQAGEEVPPPACGTDTGKRVAVIGAGPAGLAAAWALRLRGHACSVIDDRQDPGGMLRYGMPRDHLPLKVLDADLQPVLSMGVDFQWGVSVGRDVTMADLKDSYEAIILAVGKIRPELPVQFGVAGKRNGILTAEGSLQTSDPRVFAGGDAVRATRRTINSIADGSRMAAAVDAFMGGIEPPAARRRFNSTIGCPRRDEMPLLVREAADETRVSPTGGWEIGYAADEARRESLRCLHCECRKADDCRLRDYAHEYGAVGDAFPGRIRTAVARDMSHPDVLFEPGKCVKCGICLRVAEREGAPLGLAFLQRGYDVQVGTPFHESLQTALGTAAEACVRSCPTAALAFRRTPGRDSHRGDDSN